MWQLELRNIYLSRDIKSVSEFYGQRMYIKRQYSSRQSTGQMDARINKLIQADTLYVPLTSSFYTHTRNSYVSTQLSYRDVCKYLKRWFKLTDIPETHPALEESILLGRGNVLVE
jgi:hypothetical protein